MAYWRDYSGDEGAVRFTWITDEWGAPIDGDDLAVKIDGEYTLVDYQNRRVFVAGPFDTLEAAQAAYLLIGERKK